MRTNAPTFALWLIAVILGALGILSALVPIAGVSIYAFWLVVIGFVILAISTVVKGL
ncbi:MAG: hypothetical protein KJ558_07910 [Gammaproteobacteria bacterium]|nr:hypothetical protein [Gammaproteobacteria bacterium]MBU1654738.1 hypothetical protein [Gammaproteobacteria bacterium]MBU1961614.1 hypothetical protein [Gammaproteobacteria bacterium]